MRMQIDELDARVSGLLFPEDHYPCESDNMSYWDVVNRGKIRMKKSRVTICGLARSNAGILPKTIARIERLGFMFSDYRVIIVENDSSDTTPHVLKDWAKRNWRVSIKSFIGGLPHHGSTRSDERTNQLAMLRNLYLDSVPYAWTDFVIALDTDLEVGWSYDGIANTFGHDDWDVVGSTSIIHGTHTSINGTVAIRPHYFDTWAFRKMRDLPFVWHDEIIDDIIRPRGNSLVSCHSCFGGLAVYFGQALRHARYRGGDCEHVQLHKALISQGFSRIYLNPSQITVYNDASPRITCLMVADGSKCQLQASINDFINQTHANRELIILSNKSRGLLEELSLPEYPDDMICTLVRPGVSYDELLDESIKISNGSIICYWDSSLRYHQQRLNQQFELLYSGSCGARRPGKWEVCHLAGTLLYIPKRNEVYYYLADGEKDNCDISCKLPLSTLMTYRHVATRLFRVVAPDIYRGENATETISEVRELRTVTPTLGGGWMTLKQFNPRSVKEEEELLVKTLSKEFIKNNESSLTTVLEYYCLTKDVRVMGSDGLAFTIP